MLREDRELLTELKRLCNEAPQFALDFMAGALSIEDERTYGLRLADVADRILSHAQQRVYVVIDSTAMVTPGQDVHARIHAYAQRATR